MPSPKSGKAGTPVEPADPAVAEEADKADPGEVEKVKAEQRKTQSGKYGSVKVPPYKPPQTQEEVEKKKNFVEIVLKDEEGQPVPGEKYQVKLPDGSVAEGTLDENGFARIDGIDPGQAEITFPELDQESWKSG